MASRKDLRRDPYEAERRLGGHSDTFDWDGAAVDCGFIVYNERTYPNLTALFGHLGVKTRESDMSFAASIDDGAIEYSVAGWRGLVAQRANLFRPRYWSMLSDIMRFFREARKDVGREDLGRSRPISTGAAMARPSGPLSLSDGGGGLVHTGDEGR